MGLAASRPGCTASGTDTATTEFRGFQLILPNTYGYADVTSPGDPLTGSSGNHPAGETPAMAIDNNTGTKYLNFDKLNTGFTVTPTKGPKLLVSGISLTSANDAAERDPASVTIEGSNDGGTTWQPSWPT